MSRLPSQQARPPRVAQAGFTLIELLIAMAISAVIAVVAYQTVDLVVKVKTQADDSVNRFEQLQRGLRWMEQDFSQMAPRTIQDELGESLPAYQYSDYDGAQMTRIAIYPSPYGVAGLVRVGYRLEDEVLYRLVWKVVDRAPDSEADKLPILTGVTAFSVRQLNQKNAWQADWPEFEQAKTDLPRMTEITIELDGMGTVRRLFSGVDGLPNE